MAEEWVSVEERLPDERVEVLVTLVWTRDDAEFHHPKVVLAKRVRDEWRDWNYRRGWLCWRATHWMPLPQPAGEEES